MATDKGPGILYFPRSAPSHAQLRARAFQMYSFGRERGKMLSLHVHYLVDFVFCCTHTVCADTKIGQCVWTSTVPPDDANYLTRTAEVYFRFK